MSTTPHNNKNGSAPVGIIPPSTGAGKTAQGDSKAAPSAEQLAHQLKAERQHRALLTEHLIRRTARHGGEVYLLQCEIEEAHSDCRLLSRALVVVGAVALLTTGALWGVRRRW